MTVKEVLKITVDTLNSISIPIAFLQQIGEPIAASIANLNACLEAMEKDGENNGNADSE